MSQENFRSVVLILVCIFGSLDGWGQTGPAGVGNSLTNKIWLDASHLTGISSESKLSTWSDKSGNGWHAAQNSSTYRPTYITNEINGFPVIRFDRSAAFQYLEMTSVGIGSVFSGSHSAFIVARANTGALNNTGSHIQVLITTPSSNSTIAFSGSPNATGIYMHNYVGSGSSYVSTITSYPQGTWRILNRVMTENSGGTIISSYVNGSLTGTNSSTLQMRNYTNLIRMGASSTSGTFPYPFNGDMAEVIVYTGTLNDAQRIIVENYLSAKYNLPIANDKYILNDPAYILDIQGIGTSNGIDKHSFASNSKGLYLKEENASLDIAGDFLMVGHASNTNSIISANLPIDISERWERIWYLEKTGALDATLTFDLSEAGINIPEDLNTEYALYRLLYRNATAGSFTEVPVNATLSNGDQISFSLQDNELSGGYYTIGFSRQLIWTGAQNDQWDNAANWNLNRVPTVNDLVKVNVCVLLVR